jgi:hypothetical protein
MTTRPALLTAALACLIGAPTAAQAPTEPGAWILRLTTGGGFSGQGVGDVTVMSTGQVACARPPTPCRTSLVFDEISQLGALVATAAAGATWTRMATVCSDCVRFELQLQRREGSAVRTYVATWDQSVMPSPEITQLMVALAAMQTPDPARP